MLGNRWLRLAGRPFLLERHRPRLSNRGCPAFGQLSAALNDLGSAAGILATFVGEGSSSIDERSSRVGFLRLVAGIPLMVAGILATVARERSSFIGERGSPVDELSS
jgi:hypothetical protein